MHSKTKLAAAVGAALVAFGGVAQAQNLDVRVYGQVSRAILIADDGQQSKAFHVDNEASGTRFGITGGAQLMPGLRAGYKLEFDFQSNESQLVNFSAAGPVTSFSPVLLERHMDTWFEGAWGRLSLGQGDGAANGASESDLSGTGMANGIGVADLGGGFAYRTSTGGFVSSIGATINQQDFESRYDRLMYTTPSFGGFRAQVSHGQNGNADIKEISGWYGAKLPIGQIAAAVGWSEQDTNGTAGGVRPDQTFGGSISWLHSSGINVTGSWTEREVPTSTALDATFMYLKVGYKWGQHAIGVDWSMGEDFVALGDEATMIGIGYVYSPTPWAEFYVAAKQHELDRPGTSLDEIMIVTVGTRLRF